MLIRSQDKYSIINFDNIDRLRLSEQRERGEIKAHYQTDIYYLTKNEAGMLGAYSTEEKAIKVLDMIQEAYCKCESGKVLMCGSWEITKTVKSEESLKDYAHEHRGTFIFQMPQDSEV